MPKGGVGVEFLSGATGVDQRGGVPVGVLQCVQPFIQSAVGVRITVPEDETVHINGTPYIPRHRVRADLCLQQLPITAEEPICHRGAHGIRHMAMQGIPAIGDNHHIGGVFDLYDLVPGVVDEAVVVFVRGQVAVVVVGGGGGAADGGDFVLLVCRPSLRGAVGGDGVPVADCVVIPRLAGGGGAGDIGFSAVQRAQLITGELIQGVVGVDLAQRGNYLIILEQAVAIPVITVLVAINIGVGAVDPALIGDSAEAVQSGVLIASVTHGFSG